jgi:hypothetical protein
MVYRLKRTKLIDSSYDTRTKIIWLTEATNNDIKELRSALQLSSAEDVLVYLISYYKDNELKESEGA